jgi:hypothetical protein
MMRNGLNTTATTASHLLDHATGATTVQHVHDPPAAPTGSVLRATQLANHINWLTAFSSAVANSLQGRPHSLVHQQLPQW